MAENEARIKHNRDCKYILADVSNGKRDWLVIASWHVSYHREIVADLERQLTTEGSSLDLVLGGGRLVIDHGAKSIRTYDYSGDYGRAPLFKVEAVLRENFPDYKLDIK